MSTHVRASDRKDEESQNKMSRAEQVKNAITGERE